jgi:predicted Zn finger-like uncharacterized protein
MLVECPQCSAVELLDDESFRGRPTQDIRCAKCQTVYIVKVPHPQKASERQPSRVEITHSGLTTVLDLKARLPERKRVALVAMKGPVRGSVFLITKPEVTIGRHGADVVIQDRLVSGKHCALEIRESYGLLRDLGSTNGIYVGPDPVKTTRLEHLTEFRIGDTTLMFTVTDVQDQE